MAHLPCALIRGGTSKGVFILEHHLPADPGERDRLLLDLMGSPDLRQVDGLGGADPLTSKVAIVARSARAGIDVEYESVEIGIGEPTATHGLMCGNLIAGVGYFAIAEGLIAAQSPVTPVAIYCRSNRQVIVARVPLAGTLGQNPMVSLMFQHPAGAITGHLLPLGEATTLLALPEGRALNVSVVDAGTLYAFLRADDLGLSGQESPGELDARPALRATVETVRRAVADALNARHPGRTAPLPARLVKIAAVAPPVTPDTDITARVLNPAGAHKAYAVSGAIALAAGALVRGSVVHDIFHPASSPFALRIAHPSGRLLIQLHWRWQQQGGVHIQAAEIQRSARILMRGEAYLPSRAQPLPVTASLAEADA